MPPNIPSVMESNDLSHSVDIHDYAQTHPTVFLGFASVPSSNQTLSSVGTALVGGSTGVGRATQDFGNVVPVGTAVDRLDGEQLRFKRNWWAAVNLFATGNCLAGIQGWRFGFLGFVLTPE